MASPSAPLDLRWGRPEHRRRTAAPVLRTVAALLIAAASAWAQDAPDCRELVLHNGKIVTMDARDTVATSVTIRNDRIVEVGTGAGVPEHSGCAMMIDLRGRTVIPGLIDNHDHPVTLGHRPGYDTRLDTATSISDVQSLIRARAAAVKPGAWITAIGGWIVHGSGVPATLRSPALSPLCGPK